MSAQERQRLRSVLAETEQNYQKIMPAGQTINQAQGMFEVAKMDMGALQVIALAILDLTDEVAALREALDGQ